MPSRTIAFRRFDNLTHGHHLPRPHRQEQAQQLSCWSGLHPLRRRRRHGAWPWRSWSGSIRRRPRSSTGGGRCLVGGIAGGVSFLISLLSYYQGANLILAVSGAKPDRKEGRPAAVQRRRGDGHRRRHADAEGLSDQGLRTQRLRHRPRPQARHRRHHHGAARQAQPRGAARRHRPRDGPHPQLRHPPDAAARRAHRHHRHARRTSSCR